MNNEHSFGPESARNRVIDLVKQELPDFVRACANQEAEAVIMHQDAFAADYQESELILLGAAIKYAGMHKKEVHIIADAP